jgi:hypothetical protein
MLCVCDGQECTPIILAQPSQERYPRGFRILCTYPRTLADLILLGRSGWAPAVSFAYQAS